jgi:two-component system sensor histidine kinase/response regulator
MQENDKLSVSADTQHLEQSQFKDYYPLVLAIVDEIQPLLPKSADQRELLALASMTLGRLLRSREVMNRRELRKAIEQYLVDTFALDTNVDDLSTKLPDHLQRDEIEGSRLLIVDDSAMARRQISFFLKKDGFEVFEAKSGEEALWLTGEVEPDLILMDVNMDGIDGMEACRQLKQDPANANLPIIFLSAKGEREEIMRGFHSGAIDYIVKPFHPAESLTRIRTHLRVRKLAQLRENDIHELRRLNQTKDRILRVASHDLRNPIAAIAGLAEFLKDDSENLSESQKEIVNCIEEAGQGVVLLLNELLDIASLDNGRTELKKESFSLEDLVHNLVPLFKGEAERKQIELAFEAGEGIPQLNGDRMQIRRVVDNLLSNAIKFTPKKGKVKVAIHKVEDSIELDVEDSGPGIPEAEADQLFKEFGKTSNKPTGGEKSTGLGLSICHRIVQAHGGAIDFENIPSSGTRFWVRLPVES